MSLETFMQLLDDNIASIIQNLDLVSAINFLSCTKTIYDERMTYIKYVVEQQKYKEYAKCDQSNLISMLFDSYINIGQKAQVCLHQVTNKNKISYQKTRNSIDILGFYCKDNTDLFRKYKSNHYIVELLAKTVCKEYRYRYTSPSADLYCLFWKEWYDVNLHLLDICEIVYHVKHRKYRNLMNTLTTIKFKKNEENVSQTIQYLVHYVDLKQTSSMMLDIAIVCVLYTFIEQNSEIVIKNEKLSKTIIEKAHEFCQNISYELRGAPKYLKEFVINKLLHVSDILAQDK